MVVIFKAERRQCFYGKLNTKSLRQKIHNNTTISIVIHNDILVKCPVRITNISIIGYSVYHCNQFNLNNLNIINRGVLIEEKINDSFSSISYGCFGSMW